MMKITIYGTGCHHCKLLHQNVQIAVQRLQLPIAIEYVTDLEKIAEWGFLTTPGLVINTTIVSQGKVLAPIEIQTLLQSFL
jgi:small redox-active disulfide protein 2